MKNTLNYKKHLSSFQIIILGFAGVILAGTFLLMLPVSSADGVFTPFNQALFTATSSVCVTGLVVVDTGSYWSVFGQLIILILIQTGGMGIVMVAATVSMISGRKISLMQRSTMREAISAPKVGGIVRLTGFVIKWIIFIELTGAAIMAPVFCKDYGLKGLWMALFHSVSAFCNAGFDILGTESSAFSSLTGYSNNTIINLTIVTLIITGGIGFITWDDIRTSKLNFRRYSMQSKVIITTTAVLIVIPVLFLFFFEYSSLPLKERMLYSLFQAVTPRTAGFNTADLTALSDAGQSMMIFLMLIGGSPGSTAGGMKTTTLAVLAANAAATFLRRENIQFFGRRIEDNTVKNASTIAIMYIVVFYIGALIINMVEGIPISTCLFETASAIGTVGLTLGITSQLGIISQAVLIVLMFLGRVGGLTLIYAAVSVNRSPLKLPQGKITVG